MLLLSCTKQGGIVEADTSILEEIVIDPQKGNFVSLDSLIEKVEYVKLETTDNNLIGKISQLLFADNLLFVIDSENTKSINVFDLEGNFKHRICNIGNGPGEYVEISNVCIVPNKRQLAVLDRLQRRIIYYRFDGEYVFMEKIPFIHNYFEYLESGNKVYEIYGMNDSKLKDNKENAVVVTDSINRLIYGFYKDIYKSDFYYTKNKTLRKFDNRIYFSPNITDTIFCIKDTAVEAKYCVKIERDNVTSQHYETNKQFHELLKNRYFFNGDFVELKDFTYINILSPWGYPSAIYSHKNKVTYLNSAQGKHPFFMFLSTAPKARFQNNCVVLDVQAYAIMASKTQLYGEGDNDDLLNNLLDNFTEDSNPVLFFYYLNEKL